MAKQDIIQTSFASGEFGPSLYGRTDIAQYQNACEIVENFIVRPYGSAISAPGSKYVATVSDSSLRTRLIKFVFNRSDAYAIEAGDLYVRFFTNRGQVVTPAGTEDLSAFSANLKAHFKCNDNTNSTVVLDDTGSHNGTSSTLTSTLHATGKVGTGSFDMDERYYLEIPNHSDFNFSNATTGTNPFSLVGWAYVKHTGRDQYIFSKWNTGDFQYRLHVNEVNKLQFELYDSNNSKYAYVTSNSEISEGWHLFTSTFDGRNGANTADGMNLYVDADIIDVARTTESGYSYTVTGSTPLLIGVTQSGGLNNYWNDKLDNLAVLNKVLSSTEVRTLYSESVYQITTVYTQDEIFDVKYAQLNDTIWLAHKNHIQQKLVRTSADDWTIADFAFLGGPFLDTNTNTATTITPSATAGTINITVSPTNSNLFTPSSSTLGHHNSLWMIGGLAQTNATTGLQEMGYVKITHVINSYTATATVIKNLKVATATNMWAEGAWSAVRGYPAAVALHERRLWFARTNYEPNKVWASKTFEYDNFSLDSEDPDDGLNLALASNESNEIQWLSSAKSLIPGTYGGPFIVNSGSTEPITPENATASNEVQVGVDDIQPKRIGNFLYYIQRFSKKLREMFYFWDLDTYKASDKTILAPHILGDGLVDMDYQQNPDTILYGVRTDGTLALMTREVDQEVTAWSRRTTSGTYTSIAIIPSQSADYDEAWVIVERYVNGSQRKYVEYFENIEVPDRQDQCVYLDSALTFDAYESTSTSSATISLSASSGSVTLTSSTAYFNGGMIGNRIRAIDENGTKLGEGQITATTSTTSITLSITTTFSALSYMAGKWGVSVASVSGLTHLEAKTVGILADGTTESLTRTVASGVVTLGSNYFVVHVGLSYTQILYTLRKEAGAIRGTAQGKLQRINELAFKVNNSYLGFQYGFDADNLDTVTDIDTTLTQSLTTTVLGNLPFRGGYQRGSQVYIKNTKPLPIELLNVIATIDSQEK